MVVNATENIKQGKEVGARGPLWGMCEVVTILQHMVRLDFPNKVVEGRGRGSHVRFWWKRLRQTESLRWHSTEMGKGEW